jgi:TP901 family phage tail tape measure protein
MSIKIRIVSDFDKKGIQQATQQLANLGKAAGVALAAVGAATAAIAVKSVQEFAKFDGALTKSQAIMGDLTKTMENDMANAAREVAKVTTFSAEQAAESFFFLASAGLDAESSISALPQVAAFAQAGMFDMGRATDLLTDAQSALGLAIRDDAVANMENMVRVSDVLVRANTLANASVEQFSTALTTKAGAALRALGKDVEEGVAVLAAFADQGIKGELAGTQLAIVLRDLTTKAIKNKDAFAEMGISVFDSNGEMKNLGGIVGNLETALAGMSDETQKATLLQLGFSDKSLASLQALLGTSEAIKGYETELRSAMGYTGQVADKQLDTFSAQMKLLESAVIDVAIQIGEELTPYIQDLIPVLQDLLPVIGQKLADAFKKVDWKKLFTDITNFFSAIVDNIDRIVAFAQVLVVLTAALAVYSTAMIVAIAHTNGLTIAMLKNPAGIIAVAIAGLTAALILNNGELEDNVNNYKLLQSDTDKLNYSTKNLADSYKDSAFAADRYGVETDAIKDSQLRLLAVSENVSGELNRFNNIKLDGIRAELAATDGTAQALGKQLSANQRQLYYAMKGVDIAGTGIFDDDDDGGGGGGGGPSAFQQAQERVQDMVKSSQKQLASAQKSYNDTVKDANEDYASSVIALQKDFAARLEGVIQTSQNRLRSAYQSAVAVNLQALFEQDEDKSVEGLVTSLSDKLTASRTLLSNSAELASEGFSQTFIEQIVAAGVETGNELASAILESTPETQENLRSLFETLEAESETGMDSIAKEIYEKQGLATTALQELYESTQTELSVALITQQESLASALEDSATALYDSVSQIKSDMQEQVDDMDGMFGGLGRTIDQFLAKLEMMKNFAFDEALKAAMGEGGSLADGAIKATASEVDKASGILIDSADDVDNVLSYLDDRIAGAEKYLKSASTTEMQRASALETLAGFQSQRTTLAGTSAQGAVGTVININVKADTSQSLAMVGKSLGNTVAKYVTGGGEVIVSPL